VAGAAGASPERSVAIVVGVALVALGGLLMIFPFTTPETIEAFGVRRSILTARFVGIITIVLGAVIAVARDR
jgi:thiosulfate reductase cytochrome b subunit